MRHQTIQTSRNIRKNATRNTVRATGRKTTRNYEIAQYLNWKCPICGEPIFNVAVGRIGRARYVFDTNVIVSSLLFKNGNPSKSFRYALKLGRFCCGLSCTNMG